MIVILLENFPHLEVLARTPLVVFSSRSDVCHPRKFSGNKTHIPDHSHAQLAGRAHMFRRPPVGSHGRSFRRRINRPAIATGVDTSCSHVRQDQSVSKYRITRPAAAGQNPVQINGGVCAEAQPPDECCWCWRSGVPKHLKPCERNRVVCGRSYTPLAREVNPATLCPGSALRDALDQLIRQVEYQNQD